MSTEHPLPPHPHPQVLRYSNIPKGNNDVSAIHWLPFWYDIKTGHVSVLSLAWAGRSIHLKTDQEIRKDVNTVDRDSDHITSRAPTGL